MIVVGEPGIWPVVWSSCISLVKDCPEKSNTYDVIDLRSVTSASCLDSAYCADPPLRSDLLNTPREESPRNITFDAVRAIPPRSSPVKVLTSIAVRFVVEATIDSILNLETSPVVMAASAPLAIGWATTISPANRPNMDSKRASRCQRTPILKEDKRSTD